jgi:hypothetical protein
MEQQGAATSTNTARGAEHVQGAGAEQVQGTERSRCKERSGAGAGAGAQVALERQERSIAAMEKHTTGLGWRRQQREEMTEEARGWSEG